MNTNNYDLSAFLNENNEMNESKKIVKCRPRKTPNFYAQYIKNTHGDKENQSLDYKMKLKSKTNREKK